MRAIPALILLEKKVNIRAATKRSEPTAHITNSRPVSHPPLNSVPSSPDGYLHATIAQEKQIRDCINFCFFSLIKEPSDTAAANLTLAGNGREPCRTSDAGNG